MADKKSRWGKKKPGEEPKGPPVLPVRRVDYELADAICLVVENYFTIAECERYLRALREELDWRKQRVEVGNIHGDRAVVSEPRLTLFMSDPGIFYEYSGRENEGIDWHPFVVEIKQKVERALVEECKQPPVTFNCVQMNRYDTQKHSLGFHADNEPDLLKGAPIASVSFGSTRDFVILDRQDPDNRQWTVPLRDGAFFLMGGNMQSRYLHGVPAGGGGGLRINMTFRVIIPRERGQGPAHRSREEDATAEADPPAATGADTSIAHRGTGADYIPGLPPGQGAEQASGPPERGRFQRRHQRLPDGTRA